MFPSFFGVIISYVTHNFRVLKIFIFSMVFWGSKGRDLQNVWWDTRQGKPQLKSKGYKGVVTLPEDEGMCYANKGPFRNSGGYC